MNSTSLFRQTVSGMLTVLSLTVAGQALAQDLDTSKTVVIAIGNEPPFTELKPDGTLTGFGPDVDRAALSAAGFSEYKGEIMKYGAMIPALQARRVSMVSSGGLVIRPERCAQVIYSDPVSCGAQAFVFRGDQPADKKPTSYAEAAAMGIKLAVPAGGVQEKDALNAGVDRANAIAYPDNPSALKLLQDGRVDAIALSDFALTELKKVSGDDTLEVFFPLTDSGSYCAGASFNKADVALRDAYNVGLKKLKDSGEFDKLLAKWGLEARSELIANAPSTEELCGN